MTTELGDEGFIAALTDEVERRVRERLEEAPASQPLLKVREAAELLGLRERRVWQLIADGELESVQVGSRSRRVAPAAVDAYKARRKSVDPGDGARR